ncbi:hypothetical protein HNQ51_001070 [Inhella inkyongensis]|uniref:Primosomal protein N' (Replication factor Y)-superfamily II helicase n=1 Tax=Inhella inkyongensis TaxID=392593 RepID=A0A840RYG8_9BURK|nr:primosomal protein N' (replication factor Y) - superfamily II helicase [Inhella inkyongensis]MBB5203777.1 hypothetical protein [Inhella inkyongensis]
MTTKASAAAPCKSCGGVLNFDPSAGRLRCHGCQSLQDEQPAVGHAAVQTEADFEAALRRGAGQEPDLPTLVLDCPGCGASLRFEPHVVAHCCAYCQTPLTDVEVQRRRLIQPQALLPFALDDSAARTAFRQWVSSRWFAPNALQELVKAPQAGRGHYLACWTFDAHSRTDYQGQRGDNRTEEKTVRDAQGREHTERRTVTDWTFVSGQVRLQFDDELILASSRLPATQHAVLDGMDLSDLRPPQPELWAGFTVQAYDINLTEGFARARERFEQRIHEAVCTDIGGDQQRVSQIDTEYSALRYRHVLLPVWIYSYRWRGRAMQVVVNGRNGRVLGERPWSVWKIGFAVVAVLALGATLWLGSQT